MRGDTRGTARPSLGCALEDKEVSPLLTNLPHLGSYPQLLFPTAWASPHTGPDQIPAQLHCLGFGLAAVEVKHGCLCKHLCLLPHYTHKYPFHAQPMEDLFGWVMILAAAPQLALDQDLAPGDTVSDLPPISIPGRG